MAQDEQEKEMRRENKGDAWGQSFTCQPINIRSNESKKYRGKKNKKFGGKRQIKRNKLL